MFAPIGGGDLAAGPSAADRAAAERAAADTLAWEVEAFLSASGVDSRAVAHMKGQEPAVQRAVLERGALTDCQNASAALMGRIQVARDHVQSERSRTAGTGASLPAGAAPCRSWGTPTAPQWDADEIDEFVRENQLDSSAVRALREADPAVARSVLNLGSFKNCRNPSAVCLARIREARVTPVTSPVEAPRREGDACAAARTSLEAAVDEFIRENAVDSRAASALRGQAPDVQRAVLDRGELTDCQNPSTALMGRIRVAHDTLAHERKRIGMSTMLASQPLEASPEVEDFIRDNGIDGVAARQLREADADTQEDVLSRGSLSDCRNPSAVCLARLRESRSMAKEVLRAPQERLDAFRPASPEPRRPGASALQQQQQQAAGMAMPLMSMPMANMMMMATMQQMQASMMMSMMTGGMFPMAAMGGCGFPMGSMNAMRGGMGAMPIGFADAGAAASDGSASGRCSGGTGSGGAFGPATAADGAGSLPRSSPY